MQLKRGENEVNFILMNYLFWSVEENINMVLIHFVKT